VSRQALRKKRKKERRWSRRLARDARPYYNRKLVKFVELVNAGLFAEREGFEIVTRIGTGRVSPHDWKIIHEVVNHFEGLRN